MAGVVLLCLSTTNISDRTALVIYPQSFACRRVVRVFGLRREPADPWLDRAWGYWRRARGDDVAAFEDWMVRLRENRLSAEYRSYWLARIENDLDRHAEAEARLGALVDNPAARGFRDKVLILIAMTQLMQEKSEAEKNLEQLLAEYPKSPLRPRALFLSAWGGLMAGRDREAAARLKTLIEHHPGDPLARKARDLLAGLTHAPAAASTAPAIVQSLDGEVF